MISEVPEVEPVATSSVVQVSAPVVRSRKSKRQKKDNDNKDYLPSEEEKSDGSAASFKVAFQETTESSPPKQARKLQAPSSILRRSKSPTKSHPLPPQKKIPTMSRPSAYPEAKTTMDIDELTTLFDGSSLEGLPTVKGAGISAPMLWGKWTESYTNWETLVKKEEKFVLLRYLQSDAPSWILV